ncbi:hypothetical protein J5N97_003734 [Dioscorea zingiberensis]|uniref:Uncharacterized protein n=1 Tax=Dioscorea zingiberensis TaxID=325984 RepID=A0A9D5D585_9LILI|nr:hypothetical protein J5N97_003734 [Dioscorea zingiberensis]
MLLSSFARTLDHFYPLAGRLETIKHDTSPPSLTIFLDCNNQGADFIHASALDVKISDILEPLHNIIPKFIHSFFPLNRLLSHDGHTLPLLAVQVTELADGLFIGCSLNHAVADGTSFWHFINSWSELCLNINSDQISFPPVIDPWFLDSHPSPISLPFADSNEFIRRPIFPPVTECFLHFSQRSLASLKAMANTEMGVNRISTLQALRLAIRDVIERGLGWVAWLLNQEIMLSQNEAEVRQKLAAWTEEPSFSYADNFKSTHLATGSSPMFNVYGNDFGWGRPIAVRSGSGSKIDGKVTVYPGPDAGSMALEICLTHHVLLSLLADEEFLEAVTCV